MKGSLLSRVLPGLALWGVALLSGCSSSNDSPDTPGTDPDQTSNRAPVANADQVTTLAGVGTAVMVLANDRDPDGDSLKLMSVSASTTGTAVIDDAGTQAKADDFIVFTSAPDFSGNTTLSYTIEDTSGVMAQADIDIYVERRETTAGNAAPIATADAIDLDTTTTVAVLANDSDPDGTTLAITSWTQAANATITIDDAGTPSVTSDDTLVITPVAGFTGQDSFIYTITDGTDTASAEVVFSAGAPPQPANRSGRVPLAGAVVTIFAADANGLPSGNALMQTVSDSAGIWKGQLDASTGTLIIRASGGLFLDDARGLAKTVEALGPQFDSDDALETVVPAGQTYASMTLASNALLLHARRAAPAIGFELALTNSRSAFAAALGFDPVEQQLAQPLLPSRNTNRADHLMLLGGLANALNASSVALLQNAVSPEMVHALVRDFSDCELDAFENDTPVQVELDGVQVDLPITDRIEIAGLRFRNNVAELFGSGGSLTVDSAQCAQSLGPAPVFTSVPSTLTIAADNGAGTDAAFAAIADALSAALAIDDANSVTVTNDAPAVFPLGLTTVTFLATSASGIQSTAQFDVIVSDQTPPSITAPGNVTVAEDTNSALTSVVLGTAVVSDNVSDLSALGLSNNAPSAGFPLGTTSVTWTVVDESGLAASAVQLVTILANGSPQVTSTLTPLAATEGLGLSSDLSVVFSDPENDPLTYSVAGLPVGGGFSLDGVTGQLTGTANNVDAAMSPLMLTVIASDGVLSATANVVLSITPVNDPPVVMSSLANVTLTEDESTTIATAQAFSDADGPALTYSATGLPSPLTINATSGVISGTPGDLAVAGSPYAINVMASDGESGVSTGFALNVLNVNDAPLVQNPLGTQSINQGQSFTLSLASVFTDIDSAGITISASGLPASITLSGFDLTGTPTNADAQTGNFGIVLQATDTEGATVSESFLLVVNDVNDSPNLVSPIGNQTATEDLAFSLDVSGSFADVDLDTLNHSATGLPPTLTMSANGLISGTPTNADAAASPFTVTVSASDSGGLSVSDSFDLTIVNTNDAPTISAIASPAPVTEDTVIGPIAFVVGDAETAAGSLVVTATSTNPALIPGGNIVLGGSGVNRTITLTPDTDVSGSATIDVQVSDGSDTSTSSFDLMVSALNDAPSFAVIADITVAEDFAAPVVVDPLPDAVPNDELSQVVSYSLTPAAASFVQVNFNAATGQTTFTATPDASGTQTFVLTADDGQALNNVFSRTYDFTVTAVQDAPQAQDDTFTSTQDSAQTHFVLVNDSDVDGDVLQLLSAGLTTTAGGTVAVNDAGTPGDFSDDFVDYIPAPGYSGIDGYSYTITDGSQLATASVTITVTPVNLDIDGDGLSNDDEVALAVSTHLCLSPNNPDSDADGLNDGLEIQVDSDPCINTGSQTLVRVDTAGASVEWPDAVATIPATLTPGTGGAPTVVLIASGVYFQSFDYDDVCDDVVFVASLDAADTTLTPVLDADNAPTTIINLSGGNNADLRDCVGIELHNMWFREGLGNVFGGGTEGGALHVGGASTVELDGVWLTDSSVSAQGGGLAVSNSSVVTMRDSQIRNNVVTAGKGGGGTWTGSNATLILENSIVINNRANGNGGGGLYFDPNSTGIVTSSVISGNEASVQYGGGIFSSGFATSLTIDNSIISGNRAVRNGGGLYVFQTTAQINNVLVTGNYSADSGGGMCFDLSLATVNNATVVYNQVGNQGAGIFAELDIPVVRDSIVYANRRGDRVLSDAVQNFDTYGNLASLDSDYTLVENQADGGFDIDLSALGATPEFVSGFYLNQALSLGVDSGSQAATGSGVDGLTTQTGGAADTGVIDRGFHYPDAPDGTASSVEQLYPAGNLSLTSGEPAEVVFRLMTAGGDSLSSGHEVIGAITSAPAGFGWNTATQLDPLGVGSTFADDLGNGIYRLTMDLSLVAPLPVTFDVVVDGAVIESLTINLDP